MHTHVAINGRAGVCDPARKWFSSTICESRLQSRRDLPGTSCSITRLGQRFTVYCSLITDRVGGEGVEPTASAMSTLRSNQLS